VIARLLLVGAALCFVIVEAMRLRRTGVFTPGAALRAAVRSPAPLVWGALTAALFSVHALSDPALAAPLGFAIGATGSVVTAILRGSNGGIVDVADRRGVQIWERRSRRGELSWLLGFAPSDPERAWHVPPGHEAGFASLVSGVGHLMRGRGNPVVVAAIADGRVDGRRMLVANVFRGKASRSAVWVDARLPPGALEIVPSGSNRRYESYLRTISAQEALVPAKSIAVATREVSAADAIAILQTARLDRADDRLEARIDATGVLLLWPRTAERDARLDDLIELAGAVADAVAEVAARDPEPAPVG
jgi:hypothetical protein